MRIDSLNNLVERNTSIIDWEESEKKSVMRNSEEAFSFLFLLQKLENQLPISRADSAMIGTDGVKQYPIHFHRNRPKTDTHSVLILVVGENSLSLISSNFPAFEGEEYPFLDLYPNLKKRYQKGQLLIYEESRDMASGPQIEFPPMPPVPTNKLSASAKNRQAALWLDYITTIGALSHFPDAEMTKYLAIEKKQVKPGDYGKLIDFRQKFAVYRLNNYSTR